MKVVLGWKWYWDESGFWMKLVFYLYIVTKKCTRTSNIDINPSKWDMSHFLENGMRHVDVSLETIFAIASMRCTKIRWTSFMSMSMDTCHKSSRTGYRSCRWFRGNLDHKLRWRTSKRSSSCSILTQLLSALCSDTRRKWDIPTAPVMSCKKVNSRHGGFRCRKDDRKSKFTCILEVDESKRLREEWWVILACTCVKPLVRLYVCQRVGPFLVHFGSILGPFGVHFGSIWGPFWVHFGDASFGFRVSISI